MLKPLFAPLAALPCAEADAARAAQLALGGFSVTGRWSDPAGLVFDFNGTDGAWERFTADELRGSTWWYWLPEKDALSIEAHLFPLPRAEVRVRFVARATSRGGRLIRGTRLSGYFEGPEGRDAAYDERDRLRAQWVDAAVFEADDVQQAERLLSLDSSDEEGLIIQLERMAAARMKRFAALVS